MRVFAFVTAFLMGLAGLIPALADGVLLVEVYPHNATNPVARIPASPYEDGCYNGPLEIEHQRVYVTGIGFQTWFTHQQNAGTRFVVSENTNNTPNPTPPDNEDGPYLNSVEYVGMLLDTEFLTSFNPAACEEICTSNARCIGWTHRKHDLFCMTFSQITETRTNPDCTSGRR